MTLSGRITVLGIRLDEKAIFNVARNIDSADARDEYLRQVCGDDSAVADRIRTLLSGFARQPSFLEAPAAHIDLDVDTTIHAEPVWAYC